MTGTEQSLTNGGRFGWIRFADWPIAVKLITLSVSCAVLLAAGLTTLAYTKASAGLTTLAESGMGSDAQLTADAIDQWNDRLLNDLAIEARQPAILSVLADGADDSAASAGKAVLLALAQGSPNTDSIALLTLNGDIVLSSNPVDSGTNVRQRDYFTEASAGRLFISGVSISTITHAPAIFHSVPVVAVNGTVLGVLRSRSSLDAVSEAVQAAAGRVGSGATGVLLDQEGLVITSADPTWTLHPLVPLGTNAKDALLGDKRWGGGPVPEALGQRDLAKVLSPLAPIVFEWTNAGQTDHSIAVPLKQTRWTYVLGVPASTFSATVTDFLRSALVAALAGVMLISVLVFLIARRIANSISLIAAAARKIANEDLPSLASMAKALAGGDLTQEAHITARLVEVRGRDEMGAMASDFNAMIGGLQATGVAFKRTSANLRQLVGQVKASAARAEALLQNAADIILIQTADGVVTYASPATQPAWGRAPETVVGRVALDELTHPDDRDAAHAFLADAMRHTESSVTTELRMAHADGSWREMEFIGTNLLDRPSIAGLVLTCRDVTRHKTLERQLRIDSDRMLALQRASTALAGPTADTDAVLNEVLRNAILLVGGTSGSLHRWDPESELLRAVCHRDVSERHATPDIKPGEGIVGQTFSRGEPLIVNDYRTWEHARGPARTGKLCAVLGVPLMRVGKCLGVLTLRVYGDDPTRFTEDDARIASLFANQATEALFTADAFKEQRRSALHDALTGLPNRVLLQERLHAAIEAAPEGQSPSFALMVLDLDRFKEVNDTLGHQSGDALLQQIGPRLLSALRETDTLARLSGDEFALLLPATEAEAAQAIAQRLLNSLEAPFTIESTQVEVRGSFGIALYPEHGTDSDTLLRHADMAMYMAKSDRSGWEMYTPDRDNYSPDRLSLAADLRHAVERDQLVLHYQPQVDVRTGRFVAVEALMRWQHPVRGLLSPDTFIPLAEQTQLIRPLTRWAIGAALKQSAAWHCADRAVPVAVNLSAHDVQDQGLPDIVAELLQEHAAQPGYLRLEITEGSLLADPERARENLTRLRDLGVHIAIDDFGTGYSSLNYLQRLPVDELKIDKSFVQRMATDNGAHSIVRAVIDLAHDLGLGVIAEGVEDIQTWEVLAVLSCDMAQGYYFSRPLPASDVLSWIDNVQPRELDQTPTAGPSVALLQTDRERVARLAPDEFSASTPASRSRHVTESASRLAS